MVSNSYSSIPQVDPPRTPRETLPTMYDLPSESAEEPGLPDEFHDLQPQLLSRTLRLSQYSQENYFTASDLNVYYDVRHPLWFKRPDWFLAVDVPRLYDGTDLRRSYVTWQEGQNPYVVIEFLSPGTEMGDLGRFYDLADQISDVAESGRALNRITESGTASPPTKLEVYERHLRVPHYIVYSRYSQRLRYFKLDGGRYQEQPIQDQRPQIWLADLEIGLSIWSGEFEAVPGSWLRWCDRTGNWILTDTEQAQAQLLQATEQAQAQLVQAARNLLATGMEFEQVIELLNLTAEQIQLVQRHD